MFEKTELEAILGSKGESLQNSIKYLQERSYIDVKYDDENVMCLCVLPKAFGEIEKEEENSVINKKLVKIMYFTCFFSAVSSFLGAFIAMFIMR